MQYLDPETLLFLRWRDLSGHLECVDVIKRNGQLAPRYVPEYSRANQPSEMHEPLKELMYNLTAIERRTWLSLLLGVPIGVIAERQCVSCSAIYERIRGNSKRQGGMVRKNHYVRNWWRDRRKHKKDD